MSSALVEAELVAVVAETLWTNYGYPVHYGSFTEAIRPPAGGDPPRSWEAARRCEAAALAVVEALHPYLPKADAEETVPVVDAYSPIHLWTDGSGHGTAAAPRRAGAGFVLHYHGVPERHVGRGVPLGNGTSNHAELSAILLGLRAIAEEDRVRPLVVHSDSMYALDALMGRTKATANAALIAELRAEAKRFPHMTDAHVRGHTGVEFNEVTDRLAGLAAREQRPLELAEIWSSSKPLKSPKPRAP